MDCKYINENSLAEVDDALSQQRTQKYTFYSLPFLLDINALGLTLVAEGVDERLLRGDVYLAEAALVARNVLLERE